MKKLIIAFAVGTTMLTSCGSTTDQLDESQKGKQFSKPRVGEVTENTRIPGEDSSIITYCIPNVIQGTAIYQHEFQFKAKVSKAKADSIAFGILITQDTLWHVKDSTVQGTTTTVKTDTVKKFFELVKHITPLR